MMRGPLTGSLVLHALVILLVTVTLTVDRARPKSEEVITVDIVSAGKGANTPAAKSPAPTGTLAPSPAARVKSDFASRNPTPASPIAAAKPARSEPAPPPEARPAEPVRPASPSKPDRETAANEAVRPPQQQTPPTSRPAKPEVAENAGPSIVPKIKPKTDPPTKVPTAVAEPAATQDAKPQPAPQRAQARLEQTPPQKPRSSPGQAAPPAELASKEAPARPTEAKPGTANANKPADKVEARSEFSAVTGAVAALKKQSAGTDAKRAEGTTASGRSGAPATSTSGSFESQVASTVRSGGATRYDPSLPLSGSEIDAVRRQIEQCWNLPANVSGGNLVVTIRVEMNQNGTPRSVVVENESRMQGDPAFRATAESAKRAVLNPRCHPFKLPADKYERWRTMTLVFNPKEMVGT
jgi:hypothetical protein